jgi:undecaprenyl-diphosphatase
MNHAVPGRRSEVSPAQVRRIALLALSLGSWLLFYWLAESAHAGVRQVFDEHLRTAIHAWAHPALTWLMLGATQLGSGYVLASLSLAAVIGFLYRKWYRMGLLLLINMLAVPWFTEYLKMSFHRLRPEPYFGVPLPASYSFPSGHAFSSFCCYGMIVALLSVRLQRHRARVALWVSGAVLILMVGLSRVYLGVHYPSDVLGGWAAALAWISFLLVFAQRGETTDPTD